VSQFDLSGPLRLRQFLPPVDDSALGSLWACARPGWSPKTKEKKKHVSEQRVRAWLAGLPGEPPIHLVSLLGKKDNDLSEYSTYDFRGRFDPEDGRPIFQEYLDQIEGRGKFIVHEFCTTDLRSVPASKLDEIVKRIWELLQLQLTVILFDSGGVGRVGQVRQRLHFQDTLS